MINFVIHHSPVRPEKSKIIVFDKGFAFFFLSWLHLTFNVAFSSLSGLIQRLGHPWMKKHKPEIPQEDHWSWQTSSQKTVCIETHDITSISVSNKDFLVVHAGVFHCCSIFELVIIVFFQVKTEPGWSYLSWRRVCWSLDVVLLPLQNIPVITACVFDLWETQWPDCLNTFKRQST